MQKYSDIFRTLRNRRAISDPLLLVSWARQQWSCLGEKHVKEKRPAPNCCVKTVLLSLKKVLLQNFRISSYLVIRV